MWLLASLLALPLVAAQGPLEFIGNVWNKILLIGGLSFLQGFGLVGFTRILIWILTFALFFAVMGGLGAGKQEGRLTFLERKQAMVVAGVLATISAIFLPANAILAVGAGWATAVGLILIGAPLLGLFYVLWKIPSDKKGKSLPDTKGTVLLKLLISMLLFWILSAMKYSLQAEKGLYLGQASVAGTMSNFIAWALYIASIMIIYYIIKFFFTSSESAEEAEKRWKGSGKALGKSISKGLEAQKTGEEMARRAKEVREPHSYLVDAIEECKKLVYALARGSRPEARAEVVKKAENSLKSLKKDLKKALRSLRYLRRKERGQEKTRYYDLFDKLHTSAGVALEHARDVSLPKENADDQQWKSSYNEAVRNINVVVGLCGQMVNALNVFMEHQNLEAAQAAAGQGLGQQAQERAQQERRQEAAQQRVQEQAATQEPQRIKVLKSKPTAVYRKRK